MLTQIPKLYFNFFYYLLYLKLDRVNDFGSRELISVVDTPHSDVKFSSGDIGVTDITKA